MSREKCLAKGRWVAASSTMFLWSRVLTTLFPLEWGEVQENEIWCGTGVLLLGFVITIWYLLHQ